MKEQITKIISEVITEGSLNKLILSLPADKSILKTVAKPFKAKNTTYIQFETFYSDGKALHKNMPAEEAVDFTVDAISQTFRQCNIITTGGTCDIKRSKSGKLLLNNKIKGHAKAEVKSHNKIKQTLLRDGEIYPFLIELGISDKNGRIYDKKRAKYKQINRFLEIIDDVYCKLPSEGELTVCDLCCGKSYLTFAAYHYFTVYRKRTVRMYGMDLKKDVIDYCAKTAEKLNFSTLYFSCGDISTFELPRTDMVLSLHACDIATDIVLANAVRMNAGIILSTPCCHHEMMGQLDCAELSFISKHSLLKQKLCDAATDSLRALRLEAEGYRVTTIELIDPEQTPKNILLRAIRHRITEEKRSELLEEYSKSCSYLGVDPYLDKLLTGIK